MAGKRYELGDDERLPFGFNWADWLAEEGEGVEIASSAWVVPDELTVVGEIASTTGTIVELENATGAIGDQFLVTNVITLNNAAASQAERSFTIKIVETKYK